MCRALLIATIALLCGCESRPEPKAFAKFEDLRALAKAVDCDLKAADDTHARCETVLGPCSCKLEIHASGELDPEADGVKTGVNALFINLTSCARGRGIDRALRLLEPLAGETGRIPLRAILAGPGEEFADHYSIEGTAGPLDVGVSWTNVHWEDDRDTAARGAYGEQLVSIGILPRYGKYKNIRAMVGPYASFVEPRWPCRDGTKRPWETTPAAP